MGAVVVREGRIIARAFNQVELLKDATAHAEMLALTQAEEVAGDWRLTDCTLYVTKEPCAMCAGAMRACAAGAGGLWRGRSQRRRGGRGDEPAAASLVQPSVRNHAGVREAECRRCCKLFLGNNARRAGLHLDKRPPHLSLSWRPRENTAVHRREEFSCESAELKWAFWRHARERKRRRARPPVLCWRELRIAAGLPDHTRFRPRRLRWQSCRSNWRRSCRDIRNSAGHAAWPACP